MIRVFRMFLPDSFRCDWTDSSASSDTVLSPDDHPAPMNPPDKIDELSCFHRAQKEKIESRLVDFRRIWAEGSDRDLFAELAFCILTPQSRARTCWPAVERLRKGDLLFVGSAEEILDELRNVRFKERKASYIVSARNQFTKDGQLSIRSILEGFSDAFALREWLVENVKGLGYKEAGHFLRNVGLGEDLAILDRHILKNLALLGVIDEIPASLTKKRYLEIERKMIEFSKATDIPMGHLDLLLWSKETGEIFK
jgi:N-glycosylase/DNA lyase